MSVRARVPVFLVAAVALAALLMYGVSGLPPFGSFAGAYESFILQTATQERHVENIATAINFDYRGFDTLGEEFIFFTAVTGVLFILSKLDIEAKKHPEPVEEEADRRPSGGIRWFCAGLTAFIAAFAMDLGAHGQLTPGGGFQGGAMFGSAVACIYLGLGLDALLACAKKALFDFFEGLAAASYSAIGVATAFAAGAFLKNTLPLGTTGATVSSGTIYLINCVVFVEIASGFTVLMLQFLRQTRETEGTDE